MADHNKKYRAPRGKRLHGIYVSRGNSKVRFPILSVGSGLDCSSRQWCPFDGDNHKEAGRKRCYAQITELLRPSVLISRRRNQVAIAGLAAHAIDAVTADIAAMVAQWLKGKRKEARILRINESGDLNRGNIAFVCSLIKACLAVGVKPYLYSKAPPIYRRLAQDAGAVVLHSEHDFVAVPDVASGVATGLNRCAGICGPCKACPSGIKSWIVEH